MSVLLDVADLTVSFPGANRPAVSRITFSIDQGEILGVVGESGSGKSVTAATIMRLEPATSRVTANRLALAGIDMLTANAEQRRRIRGGLAGYIFQEPMTALAPTRTIGAQMIDAACSHAAQSRRSAAAQAASDLAAVAIADVDRVLRSYPWQLSGGMRQRVLIAMAFAGSPRLVIADEITTALDPSTRLIVLDLLRTRASATRAAILFISHDLRTVGRFCNRVAVMKAGEIVEIGSAQEVLTRPTHPYTRRLQAALPGAGQPRQPLLAGLPP